ncbi:MAG TPA: DUF1223 domain-containing protein [Candidatus Acidoferrum sp.]|nr:DUF1223 domain-containing protein [Candidatus Acidoferrum sp.]
MSLPAAGAECAAKSGDFTAALVELYTSEGCDSCPPADRWLSNLARGAGRVVPLSLHVDYWDYIGWKDPYASPAFTQRQHDYAAALRLHMVYTPQMVVDGHTDVVGSEYDDVEAAIGKAGAQPKLAVSIEKDGAGYRAVIPAAAAPAAGPATVWLALFDSQRETRVARGENGGRMLREYNIVREWRQIGSWDGHALTLPLPMPEKPGEDGCAVIVQSGPVGPILGAALMKLDESGS